MLTTHPIPSKVRRIDTDVPGNDAYHLQVGPEYPKEVYRMRVNGLMGQSNTVTLNLGHIKFPRGSYMVAIEGATLWYQVTQGNTTQARAPPHITIAMDYLSSNTFSNGFPALNSSVTTASTSVATQTNTAFIHLANQTPGLPVGVINTTTNVQSTTTLIDYNIGGTTGTETRVALYVPTQPLSTDTIGLVLPQDGLCFPFTWSVGNNFTSGAWNMTNRGIVLDLVFYPNPYFHNV